MPYPASMQLANLFVDFRAWLTGDGHEAEIVVDSPNPLVSQSEDIIVPPLKGAEFTTSGGVATIPLPRNNNAGWEPTGWAYLIRATFPDFQKMAWTVNMTGDGSLADLGVQVEYPGDGPIVYQVVYPIDPVTPDYAYEILVAATDADDDVKAIAAYVCDGTSDEAEIGAAVAVSVMQGLPVRLSAGTFEVSAPIIIADPVTIQGMGPRSTIIKAADGLDAYVFEFDDAVVGGIPGARFADLSIDGNAANQAGGGGINAAGAIDCLFDRIRFHNCYDWGLILGAYEEGAGFGHHNEVYSLFDADVLSGGAGGGLFMTSSDENTVRSHFQFLGGSTPPDGLPRPVALYDKAGLNKIDGSIFVGGQPTSNCDHIRVRDTKMTQIVNCTSDGSAGHAIVATGTRHVISGNTLTSVGDQGSIFAGAIGIFVDFAGQGMVITNNSIDSSSTSGKTRSLVHCTGDGDAGSNIIKNNVLWVNGALQQTPVEDSGTDNLVADNIIGPIA